MQIRILCTIFILVLSCFVARSQILPLDNYDVQNGLPASDIWDIEQDEQGFIWLASQLGVIRFDGYSFQTYSTTDGLPDNNINDVFVDSRGRIWFATANAGVASWSGNEFELFTEEDGLAGNFTNQLFEDKQGNIWVTSQGGISRISPQGTIDYSDTLTVDGTILAHWVSEDGTIWLADQGRVYYFHGDSLAVFSHPLLEEQIVRAITEDTKGSLWFATQGSGVVHIFPGGSMCYDLSSGLPGNICLSLLATDSAEIYIGTSLPASIIRIRDNTPDTIWLEPGNSMLLLDLVRDRRGRIWAATHEHGVIMSGHSHSRLITTENGLLDNRIRRIREDRNGNIWIGTENGLSKYGKIIFEVYNRSLINDEKRIQSIASLGDVIYAGSYSGLNIISEQGIDHIDITSQIGQSNPDILSILPLAENNLWLGTYGGLTQFYNGKIRFFPAMGYLKVQGDIEAAYDLLMLHDTIWCATPNGLVFFDGQSYGGYTMEDGLAENRIWGIAADRHDRIWCATVGGLSVFDGKIFINMTEENGLAHNYCNDIAIGEDGTCFLATDEGLSVIRFRTGKPEVVRNITVADGLGSPVIWSVLPDEKNHLWVGHSKGVDRIDLDNYQVTNYSRQEGFLPVETNLGAMTLGANGEVWIGTINGAVRYLPASDFTYTDPPEVYITGIRFLDDSSDVGRFGHGKNSMNLPAELELKYNRNSLVFEYVGLHFTSIEKNRYRFRLVGYDDWSSPTAETSVSYRKLPHGSYTFQVLAANCDGIWNQTPASYDFIIRPPFWKTKLFYVFEIGLGITLLLLLIRLRERKLRHDRDLLAQKVSERTREVEAQRDQIVLQKQEITDSILYAEKIQLAVLPSTDILDKLDVEYFIFYKPRDIVSGDFYWFTGTPERFIVVAADCTGHGVPGAFMSMLGVSILNEIAGTQEEHNAGEILDILRDHLTATLWQQGREEDAKDGMDMSLVIIDRKKQWIEFAGAYNPLLLVRKDEMTIYKGDKMPVGYHWGKMPPFTNVVIDYQPGDRIYMFSDGYQDQFGGVEGKKFKSKNFRDLLLQISNLPFQEQKVRLSETITSWMGINEQVDDMLVIGISL